MLVFVCGGATYSEVQNVLLWHGFQKTISYVALLVHQLRSVYELRAKEKRDIIMGSTSFIKPKAFLEAVISLHEANPAPPPPAYVSVPFDAVRESGNMKIVTVVSCCYRTADVAQTSFH
ncbi:hypothetical protein PINS_up000512 [Pythium insidiosum]|nr:hypothetical protein PINS_up000512 [Pythium insidiosum]